MKVKVSENIKKRESYRPVAPIILERAASKVFESVPAAGPIEYMLYNFMVRPSWRDAIPAVTHVDGTARAQIVKEDKNIQLKFIQELLIELYEKYDIPCLINTSFNVAGEPIVHHKEDALHSGKKMGLDKIVLGNRIIHIGSLDL